MTLLHQVAKARQWVIDQKQADGHHLHRELTRWLVVMQVFLLENTHRQLVSSRSLSVKVILFQEIIQRPLVIQVIFLETIPIH